MKMYQGTESVHRRDLVYILAPSYSGSTLLTFLLAKHRDIATVGELKAVPRGDVKTYPCSCGVLQSECSFWQRVADEMRRSDPAFTLDDFGTHFCSDSSVLNRWLHARVRGGLFEAGRSLVLRCWPGGRRGVNAVLERNRQMIEVVCRLQNASVFLDGSKDVLRVKLLHVAGYWNVKVIYLIRDGRGQTSSFMRHKGVSMVRAAQGWYEHHRECERLVRGFAPDACITIHYEDLCTDSRDTLARICDFLHLDSAVPDLAFRSMEHHIMGNQMRLNSSDEITLDERWKTALTCEDLQVFDRIAGKLNRAYGYDRAVSEKTPLGR